MTAPAEPPGAAGAAVRRSDEGEERLDVRYGFWMIALAVVLADQWTKYLVETHLTLHGPSVPLIPGMLYLTHIHNPGVAFGQLRGAGPLLVVAAVVAAGCILGYRARLLRSGEPPHPALVLGLALPFGGAIGNMIDRVRLGKVVDFLDLRWWPVFNVADTAITLGAAALMTYFFFVTRAPASPVPEAAAGPADQPAARIAQP